MDFKGAYVYLSGSMTGHPEWNKPTFDEYEKRLYKMGASYVYNPAWNADNDNEKPHECYMLRDLCALTRMIAGGRPYFDYLVMIPGWEKSEGARVEREVAIACGIEVVTI